MVDMDEVAIITTGDDGIGIGNLAREGERTRTFQVVLRTGDIIDARILDHDHEHAHHVQPENAVGRLIDVDTGDLTGVAVQPTVVVPAMDCLAHQVPGVNNGGENRDHPHHRHIETAATATEGGRLLFRGQDPDRCPPTAAARTTTGGLPHRLIIRDLPEGIHPLILPRAINVVSVVTTEIASMTIADAAIVSQTAVLAHLVPAIQGEIGKDAALFRDMRQQRETDGVLLLYPPLVRSERKYLMKKRVRREASGGKRRGLLLRLGE